MIIHNIKITNFKSIYETQYFDFDNQKGLIKLSGPIGAGKTTLAEAILFGLYGTVKGQNNTNLISWNMKFCEIEINLTSKNKNIYIKRNTKEQLVVKINNKPLAISSKKNAQNILEDEIFDVPKLAVIKMCIISFNNFNSIADMNPYETKQFLDDIFGFKLFSEYNDEIVIEKKNYSNEITKLRAIYQDNLNQIEFLKEKKIKQQNDLNNQINITELKNNYDSIISKGKEINGEYKLYESEYNDKLNDINNKLIEIKTLGKQAKLTYNTFKSGKCPTCNHDIDESLIAEYKNKIQECLDEYNKINNEKQLLDNEYIPNISKYKTQIAELHDKAIKIKNKINIYNNNLALISENYDDLIKEHELKVKSLEQQILEYEHEVNDWDTMNVLFSKTLRYQLLDKLIPHINASIQFFMNKLDQFFKIEFDQEFKPHIYVDGVDKEISYNNLSTGQKKTLDLAVIFGILQNIISTVNFNVLVLDELFSNMDANSRDTMLSLLHETLLDNKTIYIINHAEVSDDYFSHKIKVSLENKKIKSSNNVFVIKQSKYTEIF